VESFREQAPGRQWIDIAWYRCICSRYFANELSQTSTAFTPGRSYKTLKFARDGERTRDLLSHSSAEPHCALKLWWTSSRSELMSRHFHPSLIFSRKDQSPTLIGLHFVSTYPSSQIVDWVRSERHWITYGKITALKSFVAKVPGHKFLHSVFLLPVWKGFIDSLRRRHWVSILKTSYEPLTISGTILQHFLS